MVYYPFQYNRKKGVATGANSKMFIGSTIKFTHTQKKTGGTITMKLECGNNT